jgi:hypothetical protein
MWLFARIASASSPSLSRANLISRTIAGVKLVTEPGSRVWHTEDGRFQFIQTKDWHQGRWMVMDIDHGGDVTCHEYWTLRDTLANSECGDFPVKL